MAYKIRQAADMAGVTVKTLRHYERIGLLRPTRQGENGYRLYSDGDMLRLQQILFFKELDFPLKEIKAIMDCPTYDRRSALESQRKLLIAKRERLDGIIALAEKSLKGEDNMSFKEFDLKEIEAQRAKYKEEAHRRWGGTGAFEQSRRREEGYTAGDWQRINGEMSGIMESFAGLRSGDPTGEAAQELVGRWRDFITRNFYDCTVEILSGLGEMYVGDERFKESFDRWGQGTALFVSRAIAAYCQKQAL